MKRLNCNLFLSIGGLGLLLIIDMMHLCEALQVCKK